MKKADVRVETYDMEVPNNAGWRLELNYYTDEAEGPMVEFYIYHTSYGVKYLIFGFKNDDEGTLEIMLDYVAESFEEHMTNYIAFVERSETE